MATRKLWRLCAPADIDSQAPGAETRHDHLAGYALDLASTPRFDGIKGVTVSDQFDTYTNVELVRIDLMTLPTDKSLEPPPPPPLPDPDIDDFKCYRVRRVRRPVGGQGVTVKDQFIDLANLPPDGVLHVDLVRAVRLCMSATRTGLPRISPSDAMMCYKTRTTSGFPTFRGPENIVYIGNELDSRSLERVNHLRELCVPAVVTLPDLP